jgi:ATP-dependent Clp protease, protease subunit
MLGQELLDHRILFLGDEVTAESANTLVASLLMLDADDHDASIDLYINSPGGSLSDGLAVIDTMRCVAAPVSTICVGRAASMAALILAAGERGRRLITPYAEVMIHQVFAGFSGRTNDVRLATEHTMRLQALIENLLAEWTGQSVERVRQDMQVDYWMTSSEALAYGLVDALIEPTGRSSSAGKGR